MRNIAIIPARTGSKRIRNKNLITCKGKTLIDMTLDWAVEFGGFSRIILTTDIPFYLENKINKVEALSRPKDLCQDESLMADVVYHALDQSGIGKDCRIWLLQATSPLRAPGDFWCILNRFKEAEEKLSIPVKALMSVCQETEKHPNRCYKIHAGTIVPLTHTNFKNAQNLYPVFWRNGMYYVFYSKYIDEIMKTKSFDIQPCIPAIMSADRSVNINEERDVREYLSIVQDRTLYEKILHSDLR